ncbi:MAG: sulfotransferase family protein [Burkholderiales bacterium]
MSQGSQPVFVVGAARSGTTLVQSLIAALPGFFSCPETHFFDELMSTTPICGGYQLHRPKLQLLETVSEKRLLESFSKAHAGFLKIPAQVQDELLAEARAGQLTPKDYLLTLIKSCSPEGKIEKSRWVEKTPVHASYLEQIFELFPDVQIVCMRRNPSGVLTSAASTFGIPVCIAALDYYRTYRDVKHFLDRNPSRSKQIFFASYDKILRSDEMLEELLKFLKIENVPSGTLVRLASKDEFVALYGNSVMGTIQPGMVDATPARSVNQWRSKAIEGFAALLEQPHSMKGKSILPMAFDMIFGIAYVARWRLRWLVSITGFFLCSKVR